MPLAVEAAVLGVYEETWGGGRWESIITLVFVLLFGAHLGVTT